MLMENVIPTILPLRFQRPHATNITIGLIVLSLVGMGYTDRMGRWLSSGFGHTLHVPPVSLEIVTLVGVVVTVQ